MRISDWSSDVCSSDLACIPEYRQLTATACKRVSQQEIELADLVAAVIGSGQIVALDIDLLRIRQHLQRRGAADQAGARHAGQRGAEVRECSGVEASRSVNHRALHGACPSKWLNRTTTPI